MGTGGETKTCPDCAEEVEAAARVCRFCGYRFTDAASPRHSGPQSPAPAPSSPPTSTEDPGLASRVLSQRAAQGGVVGWLTAPVYVRSLFSARRIGCLMPLLMILTAVILFYIWEPLAGVLFFPVAVVVWVTLAAVPVNERSTATVPRWTGLVLMGAVGVFALSTYEVGPDIDEASEVEASVTKQMGYHAASCRLVGKHEIVDFVWKCDVTLQPSDEVTVDYCYSTEEGHTEAVTETDCQYATPYGGGQRLRPSSREQEEDHDLF